MSVNVTRWLFSDPVASESYRVPINPREMSDPTATGRTFTHGLYDRPFRIRTFETPSAIVEWTFGGVINTQAHHDELLRWSKKSTNVGITDHLGRTWEVIFKSFEPTERRPTKAQPWRFTYTMRALILRRIS